MDAECARCTCEFDEEEQEMGGGWIADFYENGDDAYFCEMCAEFMSDLFNG